MDRGKKRAQKSEKPVKPVNLNVWAPVVIILGFAIGIVICWITFSYLAGN